MNVPLMIDAGRFDRQLTIEVPVEIADGCGGYTTGYSVLDSVWAHICPIRSQPVSSGDTRREVITHAVFIRFRPGVVAGSRFITGSRVFQVVAIHDPDETRRYLQCQVIEYR